MEELLTLPGVGRKTANLVRIVAHRRPDSICVDTHVHRIANRFGWVRTRTPEQTERALYEVTARRWWSRLNLYLVTWGQHVCRPVYPLCPRCPVADLCPKPRRRRRWDDDACVMPMGTVRIARPDSVAVSGSMRRRALAILCG